MTYDNKRKEREEKRIIKKNGSRKRRYHLKDVNNSDSDFNYGGNSSRPLNKKQ